MNDWHHHGEPPVDTIVEYYGRAPEGRYVHMIGHVVDDPNGGVMIESPARLHELVVGLPQELQFSSSATHWRVLEWI